jgi:hypothetical protein
VAVEPPFKPSPLPRPLTGSSSLSSASDPRFNSSAGFLVVRFPITLPLPSLSDSGSITGPIASILLISFLSCL